MKSRMKRSRKMIKLVAVILSVVMVMTLMSTMVWAENAYSDLSNNDTEIMVNGATAGEGAGNEGTGGGATAGEGTGGGAAADESTGGEGTEGGAAAGEGAGNGAIAGDGGEGTQIPAPTGEGMGDPAALDGEQAVADSGIQETKLFRVNETDYSDLASALHAVAEGAGDRVVLIGDVMLTNPVELQLPPGGSITLDLNGHSINLSGDRGTLEGDDSGAAENTGQGGMIILKSGTITVVDSNEENHGKIDGTNSPNPVFKLVKSDDPAVGVGLRVENGTFRTGSQGLAALVDAAGISIDEPDGVSMVVAISGGNFDQELSGSFLAEGYVLSQKEDMTYDVEEAQAADPEVEQAPPADGEQTQPQAPPTDGEQTQPQAPPTDGEQTQPQAPPADGEQTQPQAQPADGEQTQPQGQQADGEQIQPQAPPTDGEQTQPQAQPEPVVTYLVTFDVAADDVVALEGQTVEAGQTVAKSVEAGQTVAKPDDPVRAGFAFDGWFLDGEDVQFDFSARPVSADIVLRARWTKNVFSVTFDLHHEGAEGQPDAQQVNAGDLVVRPTDPVASDALFGYWTVQEETGDGTIPAEYSFSEPVNSDLVLHGYWTALPEYAVAFEPGEGSGEMTPLTATAGTQYTLPACTFTAPEGKRFASWDKGAAGDVITIDGDTVLIAQWENIPVYTISFFSNGGSGDMRPVTMYEGSSFVLPQSAFTAPAGKVFAGWDKGAAGTTLVINGDLALHAMWNEAPVVAYTVSFDANGGTGVMEPVTVKQGEPFIIPDCAFNAPEGQVFAGWDKGTPSSVITVGEDTVLRALWIAQETQAAVYSVTFYTDRGDTPVGQLVEAGQRAIKPEDPTASGYLFGGWYTGIDLLHAFDFNTPIGSNMTLYAKWEEAPTTIQFFTVAFYTERGTAPAQQSVERGMLAVKPADPSAQGYVFGGWFTEKECKNLYDFNTPVTTNLTLFAKWAETPSQSCVVYFHSNGHGNSPNPQPLMTGQLLQKPSDPTATGYTFTGWFLDAAGNEAFNFQAPVTGDLTLYAGWTPNRYTIRFDSNEGAGTMSSLSCIYGTRATLPADAFTRTGYTFAGWNTEKDGTGVNYTDQAIVLNLTNSNGGVVPLFAQWKNIYSVIEGGNAVIPKEGTTGFTFRVDGDFTKFTGISIDGREVSQTQYTSWAGSTFVRLDRDFVRQMTEGDHTVRFLYTDGSVETNFNIAGAASASTVRPHNVLLWIIIIVIILAIIVCTMVIIHIRRRNAM